MQLTDQPTSVVHFVDQVLLDAINSNTSDVHFEPFADHFRIRFRQDGILIDKQQPPVSQASHLTTRLKILANLDISERRLPQDGRFQFTMPDARQVDFRVNTCPTLHGEKIVLRLLESSDQRLALNSLGMNQHQQDDFLRYIQRSQGMILVTGPTGSGKTITLYTALQLINQPEKNISTVEDPIEIQLQGINQVQMNAKAGMHFATALRAFLRQDPDVIMIGEIRDLETAQASIKAAHTGHLVLSTLHTNSAPETILRLVNMGIAAYNIVSSVSLVIAQRLVRRLCEHCKKSVELPAATLKQVGFDLSHNQQPTLYQAVGCEFCTHGFKNRIGIYQVMPVSDAMKKIILTSHDSMLLEKQTISEGIMTLRQAGLEKVALGITSLSEINRVIGDQ